MNKIASRDFTDSTLLLDKIVFCNLSTVHIFQISQLESVQCTLFTFESWVQCTFLQIASIIVKIMTACTPRFHIFLDVVHTIQL